MNLISYFYNFFRIIAMFFATFKGPNIYDVDSDIEHDPIDDIQYDIVHDNHEIPLNEIHPLPLEEAPSPLRHRTNRRCGYCREVGHNVTECSSNEVVLHSNQLEELMNDPTTTIDRLHEWLSNKSEALIKVILCKMRLVRFTTHLTHLQLVNIILSRMDQIRVGRNALQNIINNANQIADEYRGELQLPRFEITDENVYNKLSITTSEVTNNSEDIICPICFENVEQEKICKTNCNHEFCKDCMNKSLRDNIIIKNESGCPLCRSKITHLYISTDSH